jgi:hypothetical protein
MIAFWKIFIFAWSWSSFHKGSWATVKNHGVYPYVTISRFQRFCLQKRQWKIRKKGLSTMTPFPILYDIGNGQINCVISLYAKIYAITTRHGSVGAVWNGQEASNQPHHCRVFDDNHQNMVFRPWWTTFPTENNTTTTKVTIIAVGWTMNDDNYRWNRPQRRNQPHFTPSLSVVTIACFSLSFIFLLVTINCF